MQVRTSEQSKETTYRRGRTVSSVGGNRTLSTIQELEADKFQTVLQELAPFLKWLHDSSRIQEGELGVGFFQATGISTKLLPRNNRGPELCIRFYVPHKLPLEALNEDWDMIYRQFQEYGPKLRFGSMAWDKREIAIPPSIMGYPTDVCEKT